MKRLDGTRSIGDLTFDLTLRHEYEKAIVLMRGESGLANLLKAVYHYEHREQRFNIGCFFPSEPAHPCGVSFSFACCHQFSQFRPRTRDANGCKSPFLADAHAAITPKSGNCRHPLQSLLVDTGLGHRGAVSN